MWIVAICLVRSAHGHGHHNDAIPEGEGISNTPIDSILWTHILVQTLAWGILFPTGMVLGVRQPHMSILQNEVNANQSG